MLGVSAGVNSFDIWCHKKQFQPKKISMLLFLHKNRIWALIIIINERKQNTNRKIEKYIHYFNMVLLKLYAKIQSYLYIS